MKMERILMVVFLFMTMFSSWTLSFPYNMQSGFGYPQENCDLRADFYDESCPSAQEIVKSVVEEAVENEARMAASLLRLHFHDCFAQGCDGSILLDDNEKYNIVSEKGSNPNRNSVRGFEVIDKIKKELEEECPQTVSCADILAIAARDSVAMTGGQSWEVLLGRQDSRTASLSDSNNNIPAPNSSLDTLISKFKLQGLDETDLIALSGSHTIGKSRCVSFKQRLYNQNGNGQPDFSIEKTYFNELISRCPSSGGDENLFDLDVESPTDFDNKYYMNLLYGRGLLNSDQVLVEMRDYVEAYASDGGVFLEQFAKSMVKMGNINPLTGDKGEIRVDCRTPL